MSKAVEQELITIFTFMQKILESEKFIFSFRKSFIDSQGSDYCKILYIDFLRNKYLKKCKEDRGWG